MTLTRLSLATPVAVVAVVIDGLRLMLFGAIALQRLGSRQQVQVLTAGEPL